MTENYLKPLINAVYRMIYLYKHEMQRIF